MNHVLGMCFKQLMSHLRLELLGRHDGVFRGSGCMYFAEVFAWLHSREVCLSHVAIFGQFHDISPHVIDNSPYNVEYRSSDASTAVALEFGCGDNVV